jgi:predicted ribosome quality control (RQC) complex YloA/Tae2 family protein
MDHGPWTVEVHNNFYFLRQITVALETIVRGTEVISCFSQSKDELVLEFYSKTRHLFLVASLQPELQCLSFPPKYNRARKNSIDLFPEIIGQSVLGVRQFTNERSLALRIGESMLLIFKMHGKQSNVILRGREGASTVFRHNLPADCDLDPETLDRDIDWSRETFEEKQDDLRSLYVTFGRPVW